MSREKLTSPGSRVGVVVFMALWSLLAFTGGASRNDEFQQVVLWCGSAVIGGLAFVVAPSGSWREVRPALIFWGLAFLILVLQVVPLPPALWTALPGREFYAQAAPIAGVEQPWRPVSLSPSRTYYTLLGLLPPLAVILAYPLMRADRMLRAGQIVLGVVLLSALIGVVQAAAGGTDRFIQFYRITNPGSAVGLFANRNHQALLLASSLPLIAWWASATRVRDRTLESARLYGAAALLLPILLLIVVTGSRGGLIASIIGVAGFVWLYQNDAAVRLGKARVPIKLLLIAALVAAAIAAALIAARSEAIARLATEGLTGQQRFDVLAPGMEMVRQFFPVGSGSGTFATVYQRFEPVETLNTTYVNQAHNDPLQLLIELGLPGVLLLLLFLVWFAVTTVRALRTQARADRMRRIGLASAVAVLATLIFSFHDYPLRTPLIACLFTLHALLLNDASSSMSASSRRHSE